MHWSTHYTSVGINQRSVWRTICSRKTCVLDVPTDKTIGSTYFCRESTLRSAIKPAHSTRNAHARRSNVSHDTPKISTELPMVPFIPTRIKVKSRITATSTRNKSKCTRGKRLYSQPNSTYQTNYTRRPNKPLTKQTYVYRQRATECSATKKQTTTTCSTVQVRKKGCKQPKPNWHTPAISDEEIRRKCEHRWYGLRQCV